LFRPANQRRWMELRRTKCRGEHDLTIDASIESDASVHLSVLPALTGLTREFSASDLQGGLQFGAVGMSLTS